MSETKIAIITGQWNPELTNALYDGAVSKFNELNVNESQVKRFVVPGCMEMPRMARLLSEKGDYSAIICFGVQINCPAESNAVMSELLRISTTMKTPVLNGIIVAPNLDEAKKSVFLGPICAKASLDIIKLESELGNFKLMQKRGLENRRLMR